MARRASIPYNRLARPARDQRAKSMTEYERTIEWLYALEAAKGMDFKLERVSLALQRLGDPQRRFLNLHIAGTNGKGSVAAMLHAVLDAAGYRVGLYTSPHLVDLGERIRIGANPIDADAVVELANEVRGVATGRGIDLTFFEFLTVMAFVHFARHAVDVAVVEVGLGGRLDATNVVDPAAAVITTIGFDHMQWLGESIGAIAAEKGGIVKAGRPLVLGRIEGEALSVLREIAAQRGATVLEADRDYRIRETRAASADAGESTQGAPGTALFRFDCLGWQVDEITVGLRGAHQVDNAATALAALAVVRDRLPVSDDAVRRGMAAVRWPGRLDVVATAPLTILDGAHNADGAAALARELPGLLRGRPMHLLFAVMRDKDWRPMAEHLAPLCASVVVTEVLPPRGAPAAAVAEAFAAYCPVTVEADVTRAWQCVRARAGDDQAIVAAGSLFLIGALSATVLAGAMRRGGAPGTLHP
jgi:dihydrofolate synthase / folylpolyglutamate synthase